MVGETRSIDVRGFCSIRAKPSKVLQGPCHPLWRREQHARETEGACLFLQVVARATSLPDDRLQLSA